MAFAWPIRGLIEATYRLEPSPTEKVLFWCTILCTWRNELHPQDALHSAGSTYSTCPGAKVVVTQVVGGKDIVPCDGMLYAFQTARQIEDGPAQIQARKKVFSVEDAMGLRFTIIRSDVGLSPSPRAATSVALHVLEGKHMAQAVQAPPPTPVEPVTEILHGIEISDPYRWLEEQNSPRTRRWLDEQAAYTRAYLDAIPERAQIRERVRELLSLKEAISEPWNVGERYFFLKRRKGEEQPVIVVRDGLPGPERFWLTQQNADWRINCRWCCCDF